MIPLHPRTDAGSFVLFDPAAIPEGIPPMSPSKLKSRLMELVDSGKLLVFDPHADGDYWVNLFVEEEFPERFLKRGRGRATGYVQIPSGRLFVVDAEDLAIRRNPGTNANPKMGGEASVLPGCYSVQAFAMNWSHRAIQAEFKRRVGKEDFEKEQRAQVVLAVLFYSTLACCVGFLAKVINYGLANLGYWLAVLLALFASLALCIRRHNKSRSFRVREQVESEFPSVAIRLTRIDSNVEPSSMRGFKLDMD